MSNKNIRTKFFGELIEELKKVEWPDRRKTIKLTTIVIIVSLIIGIYIGIIDILLTKGLEFITKFR
ncbi:MAG: preprotein translocase subunit SecE [Patescibacteria group bacterium]|nr:preprotein translocase subunit SecE [Patescibacteria group bacterium]